MRKVHFDMKRATVKFLVRNEGSGRLKVVDVVASNKQCSTDVSGTTRIAGA
jgi:hypothetical protein